MNVIRTRLIRIGFILGLLALLVSGVSIEPKQVMARPASTGGPDGEPYGNGDPTGDDVPSPSPKGSGRLYGAAKVNQQATLSTQDRWTIYIRLLIRLGIR